MSDITGPQKDVLSKDIYRYEMEYVSKAGVLFEGIQFMLEELHKRGYILTICSNGSEQYVNLVINKCNIRPLFQIVKAKNAVCNTSNHTTIVLHEPYNTYIVFIIRTINLRTVSPPHTRLLLHIKTLSTRYKLPGTQCKRQLLRLLRFI